MTRIGLFWILLVFQLIFLITQYSLVNLGTGKALRKEFNEMTFDDLANQGRLLLELVPQEQFLQNSLSDEKTEQMKKICLEGRIRLTLMNSVGVVFFDSHHDYRTMENHAGRPEMVKALEGLPGKSSRYSNTLNNNMFYYAVPYFSGKKIIGTLRIAFAEEKATRGQIRISKLLGAINLIILIVTAAIVAFLTSKLIVIIRKVEDVALMIGQGESPSEYPRTISRELTSLVETIATMASEIDRQQEKLTELSLLDSMTGLFNRRKFDEVLEYECKMCNRSNSPLSFLIIDIDYFKKYNDALGHPAGDECLKEVAQLLKQTVHRQTDVVMRLGGEEFGVLMPDTGKEGAVHMAQQIHDTINSAGLPHPDSPVASYVTLSIGLETINPTKNCGGTDLFDRADRALYQAKSEGRNRVVVYSSSS